jgi:predicted nicotinamide N-methyase
MKTDPEVSLPTEWIARADAAVHWIWQPTRIAGVTIPLAVAADPDAMLIDACRRQDEGEEGVIDPFWATTWRAASGLDRFLDQIDLKDRAVLELGCGTGHAGIAAALRGGNVVLTDGVEDPLHLVRLSLRRAQLNCDVRRLRFGDDYLERKFPIILGSDVTYLRELWPVLETCLLHHLDVNGAIYLSDPFRFISNEFRDWITKRAWTYREHRIEMEDQPQYPIRIMELRLPH